MVEDGFELKLGATVIVISLKETPPVLNTLTKLNISVQSTKQGKNCWIWQTGKGDQYRCI